MYVVHVTKVSRVPAQCSVTKVFNHNVECSSTVWDQYLSSAIGSGPRYMICVSLFSTLRESKNLLPCENHVQFLHGCRFFDSHNEQKRATKSDTSGHCLICNGIIHLSR